MEKSWKNILHEYCQKNGLDKPIYNTNKIGTTENNQIIWQSFVSIGTKKVDGIDYTKKGAESRSASFMYLLIKEQETLNLDNNSNIIGRKQKLDNVNEIKFTEYNRIILVDGENCDFTMDKLKLDDLVLIFVAKNTSKNIVFKYQEKYNNVYVFISDCVGQDAADHLLSFYAGILSVIFTEGKYYVLTKDHYGQSLEKFMKNCKFICCLTEL